MAGRNLLADAPSTRKGRNLLTKPEPEGLLYQIPGIGPYLKSADEAVSSVIGRAPNAQEGVQGLSDMARIGVNAVSLGGADYMAGGNQAQLTDEARKRMGLPATLATEFVAGSLTPTGIPKRVKQAGRVVSTIAHGASSGVQGIIDAYTHGERDFGDLAKAGALSSGLSAVASTVADPIASWMSKRKARAEAVEGQTYKTAEDLEKGKKAAYKVVDSSGAVYTARDLRALGAQLQQMKLSPGLDDRAIALRNRLKGDWTGKDIRPEDLDDLRKYIYKKTKTDPDAIPIGQKMIKAMDKFTAKTPVYTPPKGGAQGPYAPAPDIDPKLREARDLAARGKRLEIIETAKREAERAGKRGRFNPFAPSPESANVAKFSDVAKNIDAGKVRSKFTDEEIARIKQLEEGTWLRNLGGYAEPVSFRGKFGGPVLGLAASAGLVPGAGQFISAPILAGASVAEGLSTAGQRATKREIEDLEALVRDPMGQGLGPIKADPDAVEAAKRRLAQLTASGARTGWRNYGEM